jgi:hypothetical protein
MKWLYFLAFLGLFPLLVHGIIINNFNVPSNVHLGEVVVASGDYESAGSIVGILCSAYIYDLNNNNAPLMRLSDEYTDTRGKIWFEQKITEPTFYRGFDYQFVINCNTATANATFRVDQPRDPALIPTATMIYLKDNATFMVWGILIVVFVLAVFSMLSWLSSRK